MIFSIISFHLIEEYFIRVSFRETLRFLCILLFISFIYGAFWNLFTKIKLQKIEFSTVNFIEEGSLAILKNDLFFLVNNWINKWSYHLSFLVQSASLTISVMSYFVNELFRDSECMWFHRAARMISFLMLCEIFVEYFNISDFKNII